MQLELDLFPGEPWNGRSPRGLTRVGLGLFLRREPQKDACDGIAEGQLEMFPAAIRGSRQYAGAPLLLESRLRDHFR